MGISTVQGHLPLGESIARFHMEQRIEQLLNRVGNLEKRVIQLEVDRDRLRTALVTGTIPEGIYAEDAHVEAEP